MGVLYHLRYPTLALDLVVEKVAHKLVLQTLTMPGDTIFAVPPDLTLKERGLLAEEGWPKMAFVERRMAGDPTNWWVPNTAAVEALLRTAGMEVEARPGHEIWVCRRGPGRPDAGELRQATGR